MRGGGGGTKSFHPLKKKVGGGALQKVLPCLEGGGGRKQFRTHDFPIF